jgi:hypothetical protein
MGGVISSIPQTALNFIPGYGQVMFGTSAAGNYANEAKQMGADPNKRALYGLIGGIAEVGTNKLLDTIPGYKRIYDEAFAKGTLQSMTRRGAKEIGKDLVKQMGSEAFQEVL